MPHTTDRKPWEIMPSESPSQFAAFSLFRDLGPLRKLITVARETGHNYNNIGKLSKKFNWKDRVIAWESYLDSKRQAAIVVHTHNMAERQAALGQKMQSLAERRIDQFAQSEELMSTMTVSDAAKLAAEGVRIERLAEGESTQNEGQTLTINFGMPQAPKWAAHVEHPIIKGELISDNGTSIEEDAPRSATDSNR